MVHTLKGQWDGIIGVFDTKIAQQHEFITVWTATPFMTSNYGTPFSDWHFQPLKWLFPCPIIESLKPCKNVYTNDKTCL